MLADNLNTYDCWNLEKPLIPKRSRLYQLEPIGVGTPYVESLTGYVARLAELHGVFPGVLITRELAPLVNKLYFQNGLSKGLREIFNRAQALNGMGEMATDLVQALQKLTFRDDLCFLTMLFWAEIIPSRNLFRTKKAWCPICYQQRHQNQQVVYEPLLWTINSITICPFHSSPLCYSCPHCNKELSLLTWRSRPGYCSSCGGWLGDILTSTPNIDNEVVSRGLTRKNFGSLITTSTRLGTQINQTKAAKILGDNASNSGLQLQTWVVDVLGEIISVTRSLEFPPHKENIATSLNLIINTATEGNAAAFARLAGIPKNTLWMWQSTQVLPQLDTLLHICYQLEISLLDFLSPERLYDKAFTKISQKYLTRLPTAELSLTRTPRISPKLFDQNQVRDILSAILASNEEPPRTMKEVAKQLGYDMRTISRHFPDLCHAISTKCRDYDRACRLKKVELFCMEVRQIVIELYAQGVYPTEARVSELTTNPGYFRYKQVRATLNEVMRELGV